MVKETCENLVDVFGLTTAREQDHDRPPTLPPVLAAHAETFSSKARLSAVEYFGPACQATRTRGSLRDP